MYQRKDGTTSDYPTTRAAARVLRSVKYDDGIICGNCRRTSIKHTYNARCQWCARIEAASYFSKAIKDKLQAPAISVEELRATAQLFYITGTPCNRAGHIGQRDIAGKCYRCRTEPKPLTPRQTALAAGERWYRPEHSCKYCGQTALKRVDDGYCRGCNEGKIDGRRTAESALMRKFPDLEITQEFAKAQGVGVYRTGDPCRRGHTGYRYASSGSCISCIRGIN